LLSRIPVDPIAVMTSPDRRPASAARPPDATSAEQLGGARRAVLEVSVIQEAPSTTCAAVGTWPSSSITKPVPVAAEEEALDVRTGGGASSTCHHDRARAIRTLSGSAELPENR
jgi:hypothetical protein